MPQHHTSASPALPAGRTAPSAEPAGPAEMAPRLPSPPRCTRSTLAAQQVCLCWMKLVRRSVGSAERRSTMDSLVIQGSRIKRSDRGNPSSQWYHIMAAQHQNADLNFRGGTTKSKPGTECSSHDPGSPFLGPIAQVPPKPKCVRAGPQFLQPAREVQPSPHVLLPSV